MSLAESLSGLITPELVGNASKYFGESAGSTERGLTASLITALGGLSKVAASDGGMTLTNMMKDHGIDSGMLGNLAGTLGSGSNATSLVTTGQQLLGELFGSRSSGIAASIASFAGIKGSSASSMLASAVPIVLGFLSRHQTSQALSPSGLASQLASERDSLTRLLPPGMTNTLGLAAPVGAAASAASQGAVHAMGFAATAAATAVPAEVRRNRWLLPLVVLALALALGAYLFNRAGQATLTGAQNALATIKLPNGSSLDLMPTSFNYNLATFLDKGAATELPKTYVFDNLNFVSGSTQLTPESTATVTALATILNAYPNAAVELAGYTDSTGDVESNRKLSLDRANAVRDQLVTAGVGADRITAQGYGQDRPIASNDTEAGRAQNRRLELTVTKK
jgi:outer membrane protein OmpA-like peptidoglycan-associated protein